MLRQAQHERKEGKPWWERRTVAMLLALAMAIPLVWPEVPPLTDLPGHMARYHVALDGGATPSLARAFAYRWRLIGNLGVDLAVMPIGALFGVEAATRVVVAAIPVSTAAAMLVLSHVVHGRIAPTVTFALPLAFCWPFQLGFVNFCLAMALALLALAGWIALGRAARPVLRAGLFVPVSWLVWTAHSFGWGAFGLFAFAAELARRRGAGEGWRSAGLASVGWCLPLATPALAMIGGAGNGASGWFDGAQKSAAVASALRDHWFVLDVASVLVLLALLWIAAREPRLSFSATLGWPALLALAAFLVLPHRLFGGAFVDTRLFPNALALAVLAIRPPADARLARGLAIGGAAFVAVRVAATTASFAINGADIARELVALRFVPRGASVYTLAVRECDGGWDRRRIDHLAGMAIVRRDAFANDQWAIPGQQSLSIRDTGAAPFDRDPSQIASDRACGMNAPVFEDALARFPRARYDHLWIIGFAPERVRDPAFRLVWRTDRSALYRIVPATPR